MSYTQFSTGIKKLEKAPQRKEVFNRYITLGETFEKIAIEMQIKESTVRKIVSKIYEDFGLNSNNKKEELIHLIAEYEPSLLSSEIIHKNIQRPVAPPTGIIKKSSPYYVKRKVEKELQDLFLNNNYKIPLQIIQIKGTKGMGKSSIVFNLCRFLQQETRKTVVSVNIGTISDKWVFNDLYDFLYQFTNCITEAFNKDNETKLYPTKNESLLTYWESNKKNQIAPGTICTEYLERYVFTQIKTPKYLFIDGIDIVFGKPIQKGFENVLRSWNEEYIKNDEKNTWPNIIIVYSTESYAIHGIEASPLANIGIEKIVEEFTREEVLYLAKRYEIKEPEEEVLKLIDLLGGHPDLTQKSLFYIFDKKITVEQLISNATSLTSPFGNDLREKLRRLQENEKLALCFLKIIDEKECYDEASKFQLWKLGLIKEKDLHTIPTCKLYENYYRANLQIQNYEK